MAGLLYFRDGLSARPTERDIATLGLSHAFASQRPPAVRDLMGRGPSGRPGVVFGDPDRLGAASLGYYPDAQHWEPVPIAAGEPRLWLGWYTLQRPTPADLARADQLDGVRVRLGDGADWLVPVLQEWDSETIRGHCLLPRPVKKGADGDWFHGDVVPRYRALWDTGRRYWDAILGAIEAAAADEAPRTSASFDFPNTYDFACELLAQNYVVSAIEVSALELLLRGDGSRIADAAVSLPEFIDWMQKKSAADRAMENSSPGPGDSPPSTGPPSPTTQP